MRLVWVVIPILLIGIVGMQESFAQIYDLSNYPGEWYVGEGLKQGDYFEYSLCHVDYDNCAPIELRMWIKGNIQHGTEILWDAKIVIYDDNKIIQGSIGLGKITPEPVTYDDSISSYVKIFKSSVTWLSAFATASEDPSHGPKQFSDETWSKKLIQMDTIGGPYPLRAETILIPAGTFDTVVIGWDIDEYNSQNNEIWILDDFPFPVKAILHELSSEDTSDNLMYEFELLQYHENILEDPFQPVAYHDESFVKDSDIILSLKHQLELDVAPEDIICKENRVLVLRTNGHHACVTEKTADKMNWEIIENKSLKITSNEINTSDVSNDDFSKIILDDLSIQHSVLAGVPLVYFSSLEYSEFIKVGDEFDVIVKWTFTEYDEEGNVEHQNIPTNTLTREIFDESLLQIKIPENIQMITDVSDWEKTEKTYYDSSYNFNSTFTTFSKIIPFDYTDAMHEQTYKFKLVEPFFPLFDTMTFGGLGFGKIIYHQDGSLLHDNLDPKFIQKSQSEIIVEKLGFVDPQYPEVSPSEVNWKNAYDIVPKGINTPADPTDITVNNELMEKPSTTEQILSSYDQQLAEKKSGYDVLLASSLIPFEDDGREKQKAILHRGGPPQLQYSIILESYKAGFDVDDKGIITYATTPHEKYSLNYEKGFYLEDWLPEQIPDGQKLLYATTGYDTKEISENTYESYSAIYYFVPNSFVVHENVTQYDVRYNDGFYISIGYSDLQDSIEDVIEESKDLFVQRHQGYGGYQEMSRDGKSVLAFNGGHQYDHEHARIFWIFDNKFSVSLHSYYYDLDELIPIFNSIMENNS